MTLLLKRFFISDMSEMAKPKARHLQVKNVLHDYIFEPKQWCKDIYVLHSTSHTYRHNNRVSGIFFISMNTNTAMNPHSIHLSTAVSV